MAATIDEWLLAGEYLLAGGCRDVILCERGIRSFDPRTRNVLDLAAIAVARALTHLPIIADPSHGTGVRDTVIPMGRAAIAAGADGLIVEVHPRPQEALSDAHQQLRPEQFAELMTAVRTIDRSEDERLKAARQMTLDDYIEFIAEDELLEVTPLNLRARKRILNNELRMREQKRKEKMMEAAS